MSVIGVLLAIAFPPMRPRIFIPLLGAGALLIASGIAVQVASANERPELTSEYSEAGFWNGGMIGTITIKNPTNSIAQDWKLTFGMSDNAEVAGVWNGTLSTSHSSFTIKPTAQTKTLPAKGSLTVGFTALTKVHATPINCIVNGKACKINVVHQTDTGQAGMTDNSAATGTPNESVTHPNQANGTTGKVGDGKAAKPDAATPVSLTSATPYVYLPATDRPPLKAIASASGSNALTLLSAIPSVGGGCDLKWGGTTDLTAFAQEITDAINAKVGMVASIGAGSGVDLAQACGTAAALEAQLKRVIALGVRSIDLAIPAGSLTNQVLNLRRAQVVKDLEAQVSGLVFSFSLPTGNPLDAIAAPLSVAKNAGALISRVNILPVDLTSTPGVLGSLLSGLGLGNTAEPLLNVANGLHEKIMKIQGIGTTAAWHMLGIVPVIGGNDLLGGASPLAEVSKLAEFAKANGLGLLGFLPLGGGQSCPSSILPLALPVLSCLDANILPQLFALTNTFNTALH
jgi:hypothetical protein